MNRGGLGFGHLRKAGRMLGIMGLSLMLAGCQASTPVDRGGHFKIGKPYQVNGEWYYPRMVDDYREVGVASWYGIPFHGRKTANGETYNMHGMTAAHPTLPLPSIARVTNLENGKSITVRVNDRGPFAKRRIIDLSRRAAWELGFKEQGTAEVEVVFLGLADGKDLRQIRKRNRVAALN